MTYCYFIAIFHDSDKPELPVDTVQRSNWTLLFSVKIELSAKIELFIVLAIEIEIGLIFMFYFIEWSDIFWNNDKLETSVDTMLTLINLYFLAIR